MSDINQVPRYRALAQKLAAAKSCEAIKNDEWAERHADWVRRQMRECPYVWLLMGTELSSSGYLYFWVHFNHYNDNGFAMGTTEHRVFIKPSLQWGFELNIGGRNVNGIKDMLHETLDEWLRELVDPYNKS